MVAVPIKGLTKGSSVVMMKTETELEIFSTNPLNPGIRSIVFFHQSSSTWETHLDSLHHRITETQNLPQDPMQLLGAHVAWIQTSRLTSSHVLYIVQIAGQLIAATTWKVEEELSKGIGGVALSFVD